MKNRILAAALALTMSACICGCSESKKTSDKDTAADAGKRSTAIDGTVTDEETTPDETTSEEEEAADVPFIDPQAEQTEGTHELKCNVRFAAPDDKNGFTFEVTLSESEAASGINVGLYNEQGEKVADMVDDGSKKPDKEAGDHIYSCYYKPESDKAATYELTARIGAIQTAPVRVRVYDEFDDEDFNKLKEVTAQFTEIDKKYRDSSGKIPDDKKDAVLDEAETLTKKLYDNGEVIEYSVDRKNGIVNIWLESYLPYVYNIDNVTE